MYEELTDVPRRTRVLKYFLAHPDKSVHLHGLARELDLPVTSLRRDLRYLTDRNVLITSAEANVKFYSLIDDPQLKEQLLSAIGARSFWMGYKARRNVFIGLIVMTAVSIVLGGVLLIRERLNYQRLIISRIEAERLRLLNELAKAKLSEERVLQAITRSGEAF